MIFDEDYPEFLVSGLLVPHYLIHCFLYYECGRGIVSDAQFDALVKRLENAWDDIEHPHKEIIDPTSLKTGYYLRDLYPLRVRQAALQLLHSGGNRTPLRAVA